MASQKEEKSPLKVKGETGSGLFTLQHKNKSHIINCSKHLERNHRIGERNMSIQDKIERILKEIHLVFSAGQPYDSNGERIIVEKQKLFGLLQQLNLAIYEMMDEYEMTSQKQELSERRCEKRGEEIINKANRHADDIYAASIIYTDDALSRIQLIMEDANKSVQKIFHQMNKELDSEKTRVRQNQSELKEQLRDFADTDKYLKVIDIQNQEREQEFREKIEKKKGKRIQNEGKSYSAIQPEIKINKAYFERVEKEYEPEEGFLDDPDDDVSESLERLTGKEFAESLRRRAAMGSVEEELEVESEPVPELEIKIDLDAEYFKWKQEEELEIEAKDKEPVWKDKKDKRFLFGKK